MQTLTAAAQRETTDRPMLAVHNPWNGALVGEAATSDERDVPAIMQNARRGRAAAAAMSRHARAAVLEKCAAILAAERDEFARLIVLEAGKTLGQAAKEVSRCINTLKLSAEEAKRNAGEVIPFDAYAGSENRRGWFTREPLGIVLAITPYNDPLNLAAHKLGPAIAGGNAVILKPSELAPLSAIRLCEALVRAGLAPDIVTVAIGGAGLSQALTAQREIRMISFTGGFATGEKIVRGCGLKKLAMDLGGNAPVLVFDDADIDAAAAACVSGAFWAAGQNCVGTQRIFIQQASYARFRERFVALSRELRVGNPAHEEVEMGPMISEQAAIRIERQVQSALAHGATLLCGHRREGSLYYPTVLENVAADGEMFLNEAFAPVAILQPFSDEAQAIALANAPEYSLHAGIFTRDLARAMSLSAKLEAGGVMINDSSDYRFDAMPFGGSKYGSMGREGVRFAYEEMTQPKVVCINQPPHG